MAIGVLAQHLGASHAAPLLAALPAVVGAMRDPQRPVRGSACAAAAAVIAALGQRALPLLPKLVPPLLAATQAALATLIAEVGVHDAPPFPTARQQ